MRALAYLDFPIYEEQYRLECERQRAEFREALLKDANALREWDSNELIDRCLDALSLLHSDPCEYARLHLEAYKDEADRRITAYIEREIAEQTFSPLPARTSIYRGTHWQSAV